MAAGDERPGHIDLLLALTNSVDEDEGTDDLTTPAELWQWLVGHRLVEPVRGKGRSCPATEDDLALALRLRAALHAAFVRHHDAAHGVEPTRGGDAPLDAVARELPLRLTLTGPVPGLAPVEAGVRGALAAVLVAAGAAAADGSWARLKICSESTCRWAFYDATKNRSRAWCEWGCGNKVKSRAYRARVKAAASTTRG